MKKLYKSLVAILIAMVLATVLSASASAADVGRVTGLKASAVTNNSVALVWNKIAAADGYRIQYRENNGTWITISDTLQTNAYVVKNLKVGSTYSFRVNAYDIVEVKIPILGTVISSEKDHANYSTVVSVSNSIGKVTDLKATTAAPTKVKLTWSKVNGADGYLIQKKVGDTWKNVKSVTTLSYTVTGLKVGSTTSFRVKAYATVDGKKVYGSVSSTVKGTAKVPDMSGFAVTVKSTTSVTVSWNKNMRILNFCPGSTNKGSLLFPNSKCSLSTFWIRQCPGSRKFLNLKAEIRKSVHYCSLLSVLSLSMKSSGLAKLVSSPPIQLL